MTNLISELYIVLSDHCNFECGHCINSSGPRAKRWRADKNVIQYLARQINDNSSIHIVHFTGGEPTLVPDLLKSLQAKIVRPILYSVTTNGWLGQKIGNFLQEMHLDSAVLKNQSTWIKNDISRPPMISTRSIGEVSQEDFAQFTLKTYYYRFTEHQDKFDVKQFLETVPRYFSENIFGRGYYKNGEMVGVIISHHYGQHPAINQSTLHIGYWGYDRSSVTPEEARWIKEDWFTFLAQWSSQLGDIPIDASIDWFNEPAFAMAFKRGFKQVCLRLDKRCLEK